MTSRASSAVSKKTGRVATIVMAVFATVLLGTYIAGYFLLSKRISVGTGVGGEVECRAFRYQWAYTVYHPAVILESKLANVEILPSFTPP